MKPIEPSTLHSIIPGTGVARILASPFTAAFRASVGHFATMEVQYNRFADDNTEYSGPYFSNHV